MHTATDSCFTLSGAHQCGKAVGLMNEKPSVLKLPLLLRRVESSPSSASSTQHLWELLVGNRTAVLPRHARERWITSYIIYISAISCGQWQPWIAVSPLLGLISMAWPSVSDEGKPVYKRPFPTEVSPLSASSTQHMWGLLAGNCMAVTPRHVRGRRIIGLVYVCPLL